MAIKGRASVGNILSKYPVKKIVLKEEGVSTLAPRKIWFDDTVRRLNTEERGQFVGEFRGEDKILALHQSGTYKLYGYGLDIHFEEDMILIEKWNPNKPVSAIYFDGDKQQFNVKRFLVEETDRKVSFITEEEGSYLEIATTDWRPVVEVVYGKEKGKDRESEVFELEEVIGVKGLKAIGNRFVKGKVKMMNLLDPKPYEEEEVEDEPFDGEKSDQAQGKLEFGDEE